ncbi:MAG: TRAP transporter small permease subunit [Acidiferrobacterales bacterium]|nr:TRAP transporter small permease subunit [Acidiferrobacterales bacterium]
MNYLSLFINNLSTWIGKAFAWCIMVLTLGTTYEIFVRKALRDPTVWAFDLSYLMYGALFMMAGAYALSRDAHVRGDVFYRLWPQRVQAIIELLLYLVFFFPGMAALMYAGFDYANESWGYRPYGFSGPPGEISINSPAGVPVSPLKTILPIAAFVCAIQGIAEVIRCIVAIRTGKWPERLHDVEELEKQLMAEQEAKLERKLHIDETSGGAK